MRRLETNNLSVRVGSKVLLHPTSLSFTNGRLAAVVGPNGAGKSTFVKALLGLTTHTGDVLLDDVPLAALAPKDRAKAVAYLPQGQSHAWPLPVSKVVGLGRYPHGNPHGNPRGNSRGMDGPHAEDIVQQVISRMGLADLRDQSVLTLSGGEQMRVAMARALAVEADFLLADEPLASLDPRHQFAMMDILRSEARGDHGVVVVVHDLRLAALYADRIIMLNEGQVVADGYAEDVLTTENVASVFDVATQVETIERADDKCVAVALPTRSLSVSH